MKLTKKHLLEVTELEPLVIETIGEIEYGLVALDNQLSFEEAGRPDILAVDENGTFVIMELKSVTADLSSVAQGIRYYEWLLPNIGMVARTFRKVKPNNGIRLIYVAPDFDENTIRIAKYLDIDITLVKYTGLENKKTKEVGIIYEVLDLASVYMTNIFNSIDDIKDYIKDEKVAVEFDRILKDLGKLKVTLQPFRGGKGYWIECLIGSEEICYFQTRQKFVNCQIFDLETEDWIWPPRRITTLKQWKSECKKNIEEKIKNVR